MYFYAHDCTMGLIFCTEIKILNSGSHDNLRNWDKLSVYFSRFDGWNVQSYQKKPFGTWQFGKNGILVNLIAKKMEK